MCLTTAGHDPESIRKHEKGTSVFGVHDLIGNVWQYTDSFRDEHTRAVLLRGSSRYNPQVSEAFPSLHQSVNWQRGIRFDNVCFAFEGVK